MAEVPATVRLRGVKRRMQPDRHERVLKRCARACVSVDVARRDTRQPEPARQPDELAVARTIVTQERSLELDP